MARIPLGLGPSLHQLRSRSLCLVRRSQLLWPRPIPTPVHHRLRLLAFPMRTAVRESELSTDGQTSGYPSFRRDPFARDVLLDPGGTAMPRMTALHMLRSTITTVSAPANSSFVAQSHTPRNRCVRFVFGVTAASRNTRFQATC